MFRLLQVDNSSMILNSHIRERTEGNYANDRQKRGEHPEAGGWWQRGHHYQGQQTSRWKLEAQQNFWRILYKKISDADTEKELKETFPVFSKYNETMKTESRPRNWSWCWLIFCFWVRLKILKFSNISHLPHLTGYRKGNWWDDQVGGQEWGW